MKSKLPLLIIPYEILVREIDGAVLLAYEYAKNGGITLIGKKSSLFPIIKFLKRSIWFLKSIVPGEVCIQKNIYANESKIFSYDVEGLVPSEGEIGILQRLSDESLSFTERHFCWNEDEMKRYIKVFPKFRGKFIATGIPIQQSWYKYLRSSDKKDTALFASSFPLVGDIAEEYSHEQSLQTSGENQRKLKHLKKEIAMYKLGKKYTEKFIDFLLSKGLKLVIRKHPAEFGNIWLKYVGNPLVSFDDVTKPIACSIVNSDFVIGFNSTVSVQANEMGRKLFQYFPETQIKKYSSTFSKVAMEYSETLNDIRQFEMPEKFDVDKQQILKSKFISRKIISYFLPAFKNGSFHYNANLLRIIVPINSFKRFIHVLLSQHWIFKKLFPDKLFSPHYYTVGKYKSPINTFKSVNLSLKRMKLSSKKIKLKRINNNLVEFSLSEND